MSVSFDGLISTYKIAYHERLFQVRYDASTGLYTADVTNPTTFDLFRDDATVGDWIGFGWSRGVWHDLLLTIGTAMAGVGITLAWEYSSYDPSTGSLTWTALSVTDGTSALTTNGTVAFAVPDDWRWVAGTELLTGLSGYVSGPLIRCRISAVTSVSEGGACTAKADGKDYALKVVGSETPATMYAADVAAGWGRVTRAGSHLYACDANLRIGDGATATTFTISTGSVLQIGWHDATSSYTRRWYRRRSVVAENTIDTWAMGAVSGSNYHEGGVLVYCPYNALYSINAGTTWRCKVQWYSSFAKTLGESLQFQFAWFGFGQCDIDHSIIDAGEIAVTDLPASPASKIKNSVFVSGPGELYYYDSDVVVDNVIFGVSRGVLIGQNSVEIKNIAFGAKTLRATNSATCAARDCSFDSLTQLIPLTNCVIASKYSLEFAVLNSAGQSLSGFHVRMVDSAGTVIYSGVYSTAIIATVYTAVNVAGVVTRTTLNPIEIWISKDGYQTYYEKLSITNDNRKRSITLRHSPTPGFGSMGPDQR